MRVEVENGIKHYYAENGKLFWDEKPCRKYEQELTLFGLIERDDKCEKTIRLNTYEHYNFSILDRVKTFWFKPKNKTEIDAINYVLHQHHYTINDAISEDAIGNGRAYASKKMNMIVGLNAFRLKILLVKIFKKSQTISDIKLNSKNCKLEKLEET